MHFWTCIFRNYWENVFWHLENGFGVPYNVVDFCEWNLSVWIEDWNFRSMLVTSN